MFDQQTREVLNEDAAFFEQSSAPSFLLQTVSKSFHPLLCFFFFTVSLYFYYLSISLSLSLGSEQVEQEYQEAPHTFEFLS